MTGILYEARIPKTHYGVLEIRCKKMGLDAFQALGYGVSRYLLMTANKDFAFPILDRKIKLQKERPMEFKKTIPIENFDLFIKVRSKYAHQSDDEFALVSLALDKLLDLRDDQIRRLYDIKRTTGILLASLL